MAPDPSDTSMFSSIHLLLHSKHPKRAKASHPRSSNLSSSSAGRDRSRHKHRSRIRRASKLPHYYLKPGALAQMRDAQRSAIRPAYFSVCCLKKRPAEEVDMVHEREHPLSPEIGSGEANGHRSHQAQILATSFGHSTKAFGPVFPQRKKLWAPKIHLPPLSSVPVAPITPASSPPPASDPSSESLLESLPLELLVRVVCSLHHDQLKPAFHVCKRLRRAVLIARQWHFDFTTPDRERQDSLQTTPCSRVYVGGAGPSRQAMPRAPRQAAKPLEARIVRSDMQQLAVPLFRGCRTKPLRMVKPSLPHSTFRNAASHRVLFYEDQLCQAVAQNSI